MDFDEVEYVLEGFSGNLNEKELLKLLNFLKKLYLGFKVESFLEGRSQKEMERILSGHCSVVVYILENLTCFIEKNTSILLRKLFLLFLGLLLKCLDAVVFMDLNKTALEQTLAASSFCSSVRKFCNRPTHLKEEQEKFLEHELFILNISQICARLGCSPVRTKNVADDEHTLFSQIALNLYCEIIIHLPSITSSTRYLCYSQESNGSISRSSSVRKTKFLSAIETQDLYEVANSLLWKGVNIKLSESDAVTLGLCFNLWNKILLLAKKPPQAVRVSKIRTLVIDGLKLFYRVINEVDANKVDLENDVFFLEKMLAVFLSFSVKYQEFNKDVDQEFYMVLLNIFVKIFPSEVQKLHMKYRPLAVGTLSLFANTLDNSKSNRERLLTMNKNKGLYILIKSCIRSIPGEMVDALVGGEDAEVSLKAHDIESAVLFIILLCKLVKGSSPHMERLRVCLPGQSFALLDKVAEIYFRFEEQGVVSGTYKEYLVESLDVFKSQKRSNDYSLDQERFSRKRDINSIRVERSERTNKKASQKLITDDVKRKVNPIKETKVSSEPGVSRKMASASIRPRLFG
eukprot:snap_masked-scaffold_15-processed-gene-9.4-mRNA-1 protein AED:1.00 eAED:1.00 QI:0/-1/0/0/-1/1/1/0/572